MIGLCIDFKARRIEVSKNAANVGVQLGTDILTQSSFAAWWRR